MCRALAARRMWLTGGWRARVAQALSACDAACLVWVCAGVCGVCVGGVYVCERVCVCVFVFVCVFV